MGGGEIASWHEPCICTSPVNVVVFCRLRLAAGVMVDPASSCSTKSDGRLSGTSAR